MHPPAPPHDVPTATPTRRERHPVSPAVAALLREEDAALAATVAAAQAMINAASSAANALVQSAQARRDATLRPVLRDLNLRRASLVEIDGFGADPVLVLDIKVEPPAAPPKRAKVSKVSEETGV